MTKTWDILVTRDVTETCAVLIEAENEEAAKAAALDRAESDLELTWESDELPARMEIYVTNCEELT